MYVEYCRFFLLDFYSNFLFLAKKLPLDVNPRAVFACNELDLKEVKVYGFDYDYTLACYKPSMDFLLYNLGRDILIEQYKVCNWSLQYVEVSGILKAFGRVIII